MIAPAFTPAPWRAVRNPMRDDGWFVVRERRSGEIENYPGELPPAVVPFQVPQADAHLIAASPDLYEALKNVERTCPCGARPESPNTHPHVIGCPVGRAIAKAEGR